MNPTSNLLNYLEIDMTKRAIVWEKYENYVNTNLNISKMLMTGKILKPHKEEDDQEEKFLERTPFDDEEDDDEDGMLFMQFPLTKDLLDSIKLSSNFECWVGHTDFNITEDIKDELDTVRGVELSKIVTRYRFLIGVGRAFTFTEVRKNVESMLQIGMENE